MCCLLMYEYCKIRCWFKCSCEKNEYKYSNDDMITPFFTEWFSIFISTYYGIYCCRSIASECQHDYQVDITWMELCISALYEHATCNLLAWKVVWPTTSSYCEITGNKWRFWGIVDALVCKDASHVSYTSGLQSILILDWRWARGHFL